LQSASHSSRRVGDFGADLFCFCQIVEAWTSDLASYLELAVPLLPDLRILWFYFDALFKLVLRSTHSWMITYLANYSRGAFL